MEKENKPKLPRCHCGEPNPVLVKLKSGRWLCACNGCPCHVYGATEDEARENWEKAVRKDGRT
jgi:hypothetical protein